MSVVDEILEDEWVLLGLAAAAGLGFALARPRKSSRSISTSYTLKSLAGASNVERYLVRAGQVAQIGNGFVPFGLAVARRESNFNNLAANRSASEVQASCNLWEGNSRYENSPYGRSAFCIGSGGWWGLLPATGLAPKVFHNQNPQLIFDPAASTAMFTAFVEAIVRKYFPQLPSAHRNWLSVNRAMASLGTMFDYAEAGDRARQNRERLAKHLSAIGVNPNLMYLKPSIGNYPGAGQVWDDLSHL
jgi:hypothetical protein